MNQIITRSEAIEKGLRHYFTGDQCKNGHISLILAKSGMCTQCMKEYRLKNKDKIKQNYLKRYSKNKIKILKQNKLYRKKTNNKDSKNWFIKNKERFSNYKKKWALENKEHIKKKNKEYKQSLHGKIKRSIHDSDRRSRKIKATPIWANNQEILKIYTEVQLLNDKFGSAAFHVDHYYPLKGKTVCGLHTHENLQILTADENLKKGNKHPDKFYKKQ